VGPDGAQVVRACPVLGTPRRLTCCPRSGIPCSP
jgi:hypothetical protein